MVSVFLGGSLGEWRKDLVSHLVDTFGGYGIRILNPERNRLGYGLEALKQADVEIYYFSLDPTTSSNFSELAVFLNHRAMPRDICVYCSESYERKGNMVHTCKKDGIQISKSKEEWLLNIRKCVERKLKEKNGVMMTVETFKNIVQNFERDAEDVGHCLKILEGNKDVIGKLKNEYKCEEQSFLYGVILKENNDLPVNVVRAFNEYETKIINIDKYEEEFMYKAIIKFDDKEKGDLVLLEEEQLETVEERVEKVYADGYIKIVNKDTDSVEISSYYALDEIDKIVIEQC